MDMKLEDIESHLESGAFMDPGKFLDLAPTVIGELVNRVRELESAAVYCLEYWKRNDTEWAMRDALHEIRRVLSTVVNTSK